MDPEAARLNQMAAVENAPAPSYGATAAGGMGIKLAVENLNLMTAAKRSGLPLGATMHDPLCHRANQMKVSNSFQTMQAARKTVNSTVLASLPAICFCISVYFTFWVTSHLHAVLETVFLYLVFMTWLCTYLTALARGKDAQQTKSGWRRLCGKMSLFSCICGCVIGVTIYYEYFIYYNAYTGMQTYTNVAVSQSVSQFTDASMMMFTSNTMLDVTRAVGYKSATRNEVLCVAPIIDGSLPLEQEVHFFAVGVGCCDRRATFTCNDAGDATTRNAAMFLEPDTLTTPLMRWAVEGYLDRDGFDAAIRMQTAAFGTLVAPQTRLVYWSKDPMQYAVTFKNKGVEALIISCVCYCVFMVFFSWWHMFAPKWLTDPI